MSTLSRSLGLLRSSGHPTSSTVAFETRSVRLRLQIVAASRHLGFLAKRVVRQAAPQFQLRELPVKDATWRRPIGIIHRKDAYLSPVAMHFIEALKAIAKRG